MRILNREVVMQSWRDPNIDKHKNNNWILQYSRDLKLEYLLRENIEDNPLNIIEVNPDHFRDTISH